ncbi:hypothetical protein B9G98_00627 [Wickerhamiella sorbophila]|uniref:Uncharacterized protein n=1 Tax=Wickerhamiella sorbophila TaxID=45607 RepID=A0A2T0FDG3_9ASCO|nr:hypothetical protein B9G98_00627 [Wickerhamiella sorbophila]PRT53007.1 hypothetical protein B9G98_00627 [Wickerhamiella sorbophila]
MGKRRSARALVKNVISPHKGVKQLKEGTRYLPSIPKPSIKQLRSRYSSKAADRNIQESATGIPTDLPIEDFLALHNLQQISDMVVSDSDVAESTHSGDYVELIPDVISCTDEIRDSSPVPSIMFAYVPDSDTG